MTSFKGSFFVLIRPSHWRWWWKTGNLDFCEICKLKLCICNPIVDLLNTKPNYLQQISKNESFSPRLSSAYRTCLEIFFKMWSNTRSRVYGDKLSYLKIYKRNNSLHIFLKYSYRCIINFNKWRFCMLVKFKFLRYEH